MVKVAQVTAVGVPSSERFRHVSESGDSTELSFKPGPGGIAGYSPWGDHRQRTNAGAPECPRGPTAGHRATNGGHLAQRQFDRFQTLAGRQAISQAEMDVQRQSRCRQRGLKNRREELAQMSLTAPFGGIAAGVHIRNHQVVAAGPVITLTRTDLLDVVFSIPEKSVHLLDIRNTAYRPSSGSIPCRAANLRRNTKSIPAAAITAPSPGRSF